MSGCHQDLGIGQARWRHANSIALPAPDDLAADSVTKASVVPRRLSGRSRRRSGSVHLGRRALSQPRG